MEKEIECGDIVQLKADKNVVGKVTVENSNGILEYKKKGDKNRYHAHRSELELVTNPEIIDDFNDMEDGGFF